MRKGGHAKEARIAAVLLLAVLCACPRAGRAAELWIVAHRSVPVDRIDREELARIFLLKKTRWPDGRPIVPVNREAESQARRWFTRVVLGRSMRALIGYWNQMQFRGHMPPVVQESDAAVLGFVAHVPGAIGYVSARAGAWPPQVRVIGRIPVPEGDAPGRRRRSSLLWPDNAWPPPARLVAAPIRAVSVLVTPIAGGRAPIAGGR